MRLAHFVLFVLASCSITPAAPASPALDPVAPDFGLPPIRAALEFPADVNPVSLDWLVGELGRLSGQEITAVPQVLQQLQQSQEPLEIRTPVPAGEVYPFVEALLAQHGFYIAPLKGGERPVLGIHSAFPQTPSGASARPVPVSLAQLGELDRHPALLCLIVVTFENIDSRQLQTQLRQLLVDPSGIQQVVPCGDRSLLLQGMGMKVSGLVQLLREVDRASAAPVPATVPHTVPATPKPAEAEEKG